MPSYSSPSSRSPPPLIGIQSFSSAEGAGEHNHYQHTTSGLPAGPHLAAVHAGPALEAAPAVAAAAATSTRTRSTAGSGFGASTTASASPPSSTVPPSVPAPPRSTINPPAPSYRIQFFPHRETHFVNGVQQIVASGCNFSPVERELFAGTVVKMGRRIDKKDHGGGTAPSGVAPTSSSKGRHRSASRDKTGGSGSKNSPFRRTETAASAPAASGTAVGDLDDGDAVGTGGGGGASSSTLSPLSVAEAPFSSINTALASTGSQYTQPSSPQDPTASSSARRRAGDDDPYSDQDQDGTEISVRTPPPSDQNHHHHRSNQQNQSAAAKSSGRGESPGSVAARRKTTSAGQAVPKSNVVFKSKVVSRDHAEIFVSDDGQQIMIRDVGSSSGTFLNRLRLSPSGRESMPYPIKSGDLIQLGVDYHGRQEGRLEDIYKCIMMKVFVTKITREQTQSNPQRLKIALRAMLAAMNPSAQNASDASCTDCCICLSPLTSMQSLFLAPCSHTFHYRCVIPLLGSAIMFQCPLCRQVANLEATVTDDYVDDEIKNKESIEELEVWFRGLIDPSLESANYKKVVEPPGGARSPIAVNNITSGHPNDSVASPSSLLNFENAIDLHRSATYSWEGNPRSNEQMASYVREAPVQVASVLDELLAELPQHRREEYLARIRAGHSPNAPTSASSPELSNAASNNSQQAPRTPEVLEPPSLPPLIPLASGPRLSPSTASPPQQPPSPHSIPFPATAFDQMPPLADNIRQSNATAAATGSHPAVVTAPTESEQSLYLGQEVAGGVSLSSPQTTPTARKSKANFSSVRKAFSSFAGGAAAPSAETLSPSAAAMAGGGGNDSSADEARGSLDGGPGLAPAKSSKLWKLGGSKK